MERLPFHCPHCQVIGEADGKFAGRLVKCPKCKRAFRIESGTPVVEPPPISVAQKTVKTKVEKLPGWFFRWGIAAMGATSVIGFSILVVCTLLLPHSFFYGMYFSLATLLAGVCAILLTVLRGLIARNGKYPENYRRKYCSRGWVAAITLFIVVCLFSKRSGNGWLILVHYASFVATAASIVEFLKIKVSWARIRWAGIAVTMLAVGIWWSNDYCVDTWTKEAGEFDTFETEYKDYYRRLSKRPYYRKMNLRKPGEFLTWYISQGPMTDTGKPHGKWSWTNLDWDAKPFESKQGIKFYWYGEELSEGNWHLRNK